MIFGAFQIETKFQGSPAGLNQQRGLPPIECEVRPARIWPPLESPVNRRIIRQILVSIPVNPKPRGLAVRLVHQKSERRRLFSRTKSQFAIERSCQSVRNTSQRCRLVRRQYHPVAKTQIITSELLAQ